jgi:hypothetical protein
MSKPKILVKMLQTCGSATLHMGVGKAPLCNSGLSVSHLTEGCETHTQMAVRPPSTASVAP